MKDLIIENNNKIDNLAKQINKFNKKYCAALMTIAISIYTMTKTMEKHKKQITSLRREIKELKSKGE